MVSVAQATDYDIRVATSDLDGAETNANVHIIIMGEEGDTSEINLDDYSRNDFERGAVDDFQYSAEDVGVVTGFQVKRDTFNPYGVNPDWHFDTDLNAAMWAILVTTKMIHAHQVQKSVLSTSAFLTVTSAAATFKGYEGKDLTPKNLKLQSRINNHWTGFKILCYIKGF
ncbi:hypothetical protein ABFA07_017661 [Porites harrisoni]